MSPGLGVDQDQEVQPAGRVQDGEEFAVVQADGLLVGQVGLDRSDALAAAAGLQLGRQAGVPGGHAHVQPVVAPAIAAPPLSGAARAARQRFVAAGRDEIEDGGRAAGQGGPAARGEIVAGDAVGGLQLQVDVGVDAAGKDLAARGVDDAVDRPTARLFFSRPRRSFRPRSGCRPRSCGRRKRSCPARTSILDMSGEVFQQAGALVEVADHLVPALHLAEDARPDAAGPARAGSGRRSPCPAARPR